MGALGKVESPTQATALGRRYLEYLLPLVPDVYFEKLHIWRVFRAKLPATYSISLLSGRPSDTQSQGRRYRTSVALGKCDGVGLLMVVLLVVVGVVVVVAAVLAMSVVGAVVAVVGEAPDEEGELCPC
jgi:hypothetical protein